MNEKLKVTSNSTGFELGTKENRQNINNHNRIEEIYVKLVDLFVVYNMFVYFQMLNIQIDAQLTD